MALTDVKIRQTKAIDKAIRLTDSHGLYIEITTSGTKFWRYRYRIAGKANVFAIGKYPDITLQEARKARDDARELIKQGIHPAHIRQREKARTIQENTNTFEIIAREWLGVKAKKCNPTYVAQIKACLERDAFPNIGKVPIREITSKAILMILKGMEKRNASAAAMLLRNWISAIFKYAIVTLRTESDPTYVLQGAIEKPPTKHSKNMSASDLALFKKRLAAYNGHYATKYAIRLLIYTFVRTTELRKATWDEFDFDAREWRIEAGRMKMRRLHIVPLADQVIALLNELRQIKSNSPYLFPHMVRPSEPMSQNAINMAIFYIGYRNYEWTGHDFRATASTMLHEMKFPDEWIELQLAHVEGNRTRRAYNHARYLEERRAMMQKWCDFVDSV